MSNNNKTAKTFADYVTENKEKLKALLLEPKEVQNEQIVHPNTFGKGTPEYYAQYKILNSTFAHLNNKSIKNKPKNASYKAIQSNIFKSIENAKFTRLHKAKLEASDSWLKPRIKEFDEGYTSYQEREFGVASWDKLKSQ